VTPRPSVPRFPANEEYGPKDGGRTADEREPWPAVSARIAEAVYYWLASTRPDGRPHAVPIGAVWQDDRLYFNTSPRTVTARNLEASPQVCVHLGSGEEVVILEGRAARLAPQEVPEQVLGEYGLKYGDPSYRPDPADPELPWHAVEPDRVLFWAEPDIRNTAVRWRF